MGLCTSKHFAHVCTYFRGLQGASVLSGKEGKALTHFTKWDDISDQGQAALLQLE